LPASIETVHSAQSVTDASGPSSSCRVNVVKLDWQSVADSELMSLTASVDSIIATGIIALSLSPF